MHIEHNSRELFYRTPFGSVPTGTKVRLRISLFEFGIPKSVSCVIWKRREKFKDIDMPYVFTVCEHSVYECEIELTDAAQYWYSFRIEYYGGVIYYGNNYEGLGGLGQDYDKENHNKFQITVYDKDFHTPDWFKKSIAYQIFPDRFYNGNEDGSFAYERSGIIKRNWGEMPYYKAEQFGGEYLCNDFFGGNLKGITKKLDYLEDLGISVIYLNPIFKAYSNHRYDTGDYEKIDPLLGTEQDFKELCKEAKKRNIRIILDGVFNHTGSNSKYFNLNGEYKSVGAWQGKESPYYEWYTFNEENNTYESWWGMATLPQTKETCESYQNYILKDKDAIVKKWLKLGASGWRLDVVDELPDFFVKILRENVKEVSDDCVIIGEVWEDASNKEAYGELREYFLGGELDSVMNYPLRKALIDTAVGYIDTKALSNRIMSLKENYPKEVFYSCLNMLSSHDVERFVTLLDGRPKPLSRDEQANYKLEGEALNIAIKRCVVLTAIIITLPGVPCVYYGDEIGMYGYGDPFCRQTFDWSQASNDSHDFTRSLLQLRNSSDAFSIGEFEIIHDTNNLFGYIRYTADEKYVVIASFSDEFNQTRLDLARFGITHIQSILGTEKYDNDNGIFVMDLPEHWVKIFKAE